MGSQDDIGDRVRQCLRQFLDSSGRSEEGFSDRTNLHTGLGFSSDEGLDFVLDLCEEFDFDFPADFNPVVHRDGKRGNSLAELIAQVKQLLPAAEAHR